MKPLNKHLVALVNYVALVPLVYLIPLWLAPYLPDSRLLHVSIVVGIIVPIITYVVMPVTVKLLERNRLQ